MAVELTDEQLFASAVEGNSEAFGEIVKRWERKIFALCYGMLDREDDARDAAQETFFAAYRNLRNFRGEARVSSWLHRIAVNQCLTRQRRRKSRGESFLDDESETGGAGLPAPVKFSPAKIAERGERQKLIRQAVAALPFDLRQIVVMKEFEEMTFQEISDAIDIPLSTVKSRLYTALKQLKMKLEKTPLEIV